MTLPNSYTIKTGAIVDYFEAMLNAQPPDRFSQKFLEGLGFASSNDRLFIGILKDLGFINADGAPKDRYYDFLDRANATKVVADGIKDAFSDLFAVNMKAYDLSVDDAFNKLRTLYKGEKKDTVIRNIAKTFVSLCEYADFTSSRSSTHEFEKPELAGPSSVAEPSTDRNNSENRGKIGLNALQYHINIVLPDTRDQAVFDSIFKSMRDHLG